MLLCCLYLRFFLSYLKSAGLLLTLTCFWNYIIFISARIQLFLYWPNLKAILAGLFGCSWLVFYLNCALQIVYERRPRFSYMRAICSIGLVSDFIILSVKLGWLEWAPEINQHICVEINRLIWFINLFHNKFNWIWPLFYKSEF